MSEDLTYSMLHEMMMQKFNLEANSQINLSFKLSLFDYTVDITDEAEVQFFVECACNSKDEFAHLFVSERQNNQNNKFFNFFESTTFKNNGPSNQDINLSHLNNNFNNTSFFNNGLSFDLGQNDFQMNESIYKNEPHFTNPESSFAFRSNDEYADEKNDYDDGVDENPQNKIHKWNKFMSFKPDIPDTPVYKSKPIISKQYSQQLEVKKGHIFNNKEALVLAVRLKTLNNGFQFLVDRSGPYRCELKCYQFKKSDWKLRARLWNNTGQYYITHLDDTHTCPKTQTYPNHRNANKKVIAHLLTPKLQDRSRVLRGKDIQKDILEEYKIRISYQQAWRGKDYGIQQIRGSPYEAFEMLSYYCYNLEQKNKGTVTRIKTDEKGVFEMLFIAIGASLNSHVLQFSTPCAYDRCCTFKGSIQGNKSGGCGHGWKQSNCANYIWHYAIALVIENEFPLAFHALAETYRVMVQQWYYQCRQLAGIIRAPSTGPPVKRLTVHDSSGSSGLKAT
ncbi:hypothetical protein Tco_1121619 [Tanacetum coccineum]|uniref:Transposase MuDR plant domain-containing protein n=1 Tax=Tanacetum coccineum TaxID=301880 RepID=A0ABQ5J1X7_9ASTR